MPTPSPAPTPRCCGSALTCRTAALQLKGRCHICLCALPLAGLGVMPVGRGELAYWDPAGAETKSPLQVGAASRIVSGGLESLPGLH